VYEALREAMEALALPDALAPVLVPLLVRGIADGRRGIRLGLGMPEAGEERGVWNDASDGRRGTGMRDVDADADACLSMPPCSSPAAPSFDSFLRMRTPPTPPEPGDAPIPKFDADTDAALGRLLPDPSGDAAPDLEPALSTDAAEPLRRIRMAEPAGGGVELPDADVERDLASNISTAALTLRGCGRGGGVAAPVPLELALALALMVMS
jgi:hypothetical protein